MPNHTKKSVTKSEASAKEVAVFYERVLRQVRGEIEMGLESVRERREVFRERIRLYNNQRKQKDKVGINTLFTVMSTLLAISYQDRLQVRFRGRDVEGDEKARNLEKLAEYDIEEMGLSTVAYLSDWDRLFYGVGIRSISAWDRDRKVPIVRSHDPLSFIPDPQGSMSAQSFRFLGFEVAMSKDEMTSDLGFYDVEKLRDNKSASGEAELNRQALQDARGLNGSENGEVSGKMYELVDWYTTIDGRKYLITLGNKLSLIVRMEEIRPASKVERKNLALVPFPVSLAYYSPLRGDPFGVSVCDLVEDKQRAQSVMANLRIASEKARLYPMYLYDRNKILNRKDLNFSFNKAIPVNGNIDKVISPLPRDLMDSKNTLLNEKNLDDHIRESVGADRMQTGTLSDKNRTLGEVQEVADNARLRHLLHQKVGAWGEKQFWNLWYRMYRMYFTEIDEKVVRIAGTSGSRYLTFARKDLVAVTDPDIVIVSRLELEQRKLRDRKAFVSVYPLIASDPDLPKASKNYAKRYLLEMHGVDREDIDMMVPENTVIDK